MHRNPTTHYCSPQCVIQSVGKNSPHHIHVVNILNDTGPAQTRKFCVGEMITPSVKLCWQYHWVYLSLFPSYLGPTKYHLHMHITLRRTTIPHWLIKVKGNHLNLEIPDNLFATHCKRHMGYFVSKVTTTSFTQQGIADSYDVRTVGNLNLCGPLSRSAKSEITPVLSTMSSATSSGMWERGQEDSGPFDEPSWREESTAKWHPTRAHLLACTWTLVMPLCVETRDTASIPLLVWIPPLLISPLKGSAFGKCSAIDFNSPSAPHLWQRVQIFFCTAHLLTKAICVCVSVAIFLLSAVCM